MKKTIVLVVLVVGLPFFLNADLKEKDYQNYFALWIGGEIEYRLPDNSRVDILTSTYAIEVDYAYKWAEAVGQALYYAGMTGNKPGIVLVLANRKNYDNYISRILLLANLYKIQIWLIDENFNIKKLNNT